MCVYAGCGLTPFMHYTIVITRRMFSGVPSCLLPLSLALIIRSVDFCPVDWSSFPAHWVRVAFLLVIALLSIMLKFVCIGTRTDKTRPWLGPSPWPSVLCCRNCACWLYTSVLYRNLKNPNEWSGTERQYHLWLHLTTSYNNSAQSHRILVWETVSSSIDTRVTNQILFSLRHR